MDGETTERRVVGEGLNTHRLAGNHLDDGSITELDELGVVLNGLSGTTIDLLEELGELAGNVGGVAIQDRSVASTNLTRVVKNDDLGVEGVGTLGWVVLGVTADVSTTNLLDGDVLDVESDVVTWDTLDELFVVHFDGLDFSGDVGWGKGDDHTGLDDTSLNTTDRHRSDTRDLVDILEGKTGGLSVGREGGSMASMASSRVLPEALPALVSFSQPLYQGQFAETSIGLSPTFLMKLEVSLMISLKRSSDHLVVSILLMATMTWSVNDGDEVLRGLELPEGDINGDTTLTFGLQLVQNPGILEGALAQFSSFLLELLDGTLVDTSALVDQVTGGGGLARVDVSDDDDVDMSLFLTHGGGCF